MTRHVYFKITASRFAILSWVLVSSGYFPRAAAAAPPSTAVSMPCSESLELFASAPGSEHYSACKVNFGRCEKTTSDPGYLPAVTDMIIRDIVFTEIQGIYSGLDNYSTGSTLKILRSADFVGTAPTGMGECSTVGACNLFCGEGYNKNVVANLASITDPSLGSQGYVSGGSKTPLLTGMPTSFKSSDFTARGAVESYYNESNTKVTVAPPSSPPTPPGGGWPTFDLKNGSKLTDSGNLCSNAPEDQTTLAQTGFYNTTNTSGDHLPLGNSYLVDSITWPDSTSSNEGGSSCHSIAYSDFGNASGVAALQTGALVQLLWTKLDEVVKEITANKYLDVKSPKCKAMSEQYTEDFRRSVNTLFSLPITASCVTPVAACDKSMNDSADSANNTQGLWTCPASALILLLKTSSFEKLAVCEVYERAQSDFETAFNAPAPADQVGSASSMAWVDQLRNYAIAGCMNRGTPFSNVRNNCEPYCMADPVAAAMGTLLAASYIPFVGIATMVTLLVYLGKGADFVGPYLAAILNTKSFDEVQTEMKVRYATDVQACFPYAYAATLYSYLTTKAKITTVPIQGLSALGVPSTYTSPSGLLKITDCKLTDSTPHPPKTL